MRQEELDKTQYMSPEAVQMLQNGSRRRRMSDTQELPPAGEGLGIKPPFPQKGTASGKIRELCPEKYGSGGARGSRKKRQTILTAKRKKLLLLGAGFAAALFIGFMLAGYSQERTAGQMQDRQQQEQQLREQEKQLADQEAELQARRRELERQKQELQQRQSLLEEQSGRAKGRNEQIAESEPGTMLGKLVDKVTGKEAERQKQLEANNQQSAQSDTEAAVVRKSIEEAQQMLDEVNRNMEKVASMKQEAGRLKEQAAAAYEENKGIMEQALRYAGAGADMLEGWLSR